MNRLISTLVILGIAICLFCCQETQKEDFDRFYVPTILVNGQSSPTMLTTVFATLDLKNKGEGTLDISFQYKGLDYCYGGSGLGIAEFRVDIRDVPYEPDGSCYKFASDALDGVLSYLTTDITQGWNSLSLSFSLSGLADRTDRSQSSIILSTIILDKERSITLSEMTAIESEAEFGRLGYPSVVGGGGVHARRVFVNQTNLGVSVGHQSGFYEYEEKVYLEAGETKSAFLQDEEDIQGAYYGLRFEDGRYSQHEFIYMGEKYHYAGLPVLVISKPFLRYNKGQICYDVNYNCTYTITQDVYDAAE